MDISHAIIPVNLPRPLQEGGSPRTGSDGVLPQQTTLTRQEVVNPEDLKRRVEQKQASQEVDINRFQSPESASLQTRQALTTYQQTEIAAQEFEGGVLVGIDLFV